MARKSKKFIRELSELTLWGFRVVFTSEDKAKDYVAKCKGHGFMSVGYRKHGKSDTEYELRVTSIEGIKNDLEKLYVENTYLKPSIGNYLEKILFETLHHGQYIVPTSGHDPVLVEEVLTNVGFGNIIVGTTADKKVTLTCPDAKLNIYREMFDRNFRKYPVWTSN